jgi:hypothetical protein
MSSKPISASAEKRQAQKAKKKKESDRHKREDVRE